MRRYGHLWERLVAWDNLVLAARKAQRGKRQRRCVLRFNYDQEGELLRLAEQLDSGTYRPGAFRSHWITQPKPRLISAAPYRDRVVHHAVMNILEPILERHFHPHSFACRADKGAHAAADQLQSLMRRHRYVLQCDVRKFFPSIDHEILKVLFRRLIKDQRVLGLLDTIVDHSNEQESVINWFEGDDLFAPVERRRGLPIGSLTSQWFANWYLTGHDHYVTSHLGLGGYVRYCDDFLLLHNSRQRLRDVREAVRNHLTAFRLRLHETKQAIIPCRAGVRFVGFRIWPTHRLIRKDNVWRFRRRVRWMRRAYAAREIDWEDVKPRLVSWLGHARQANSERLIRRLSRDWVFQRGEIERVPRASRRLLEQQSEELSLGEPQQEHARQPEQQHWVPCRAALEADVLLPRPESPGSRTERA